MHENTGPLDPLTEAWNLSEDYRGPHGHGAKSLAMAIGEKPSHFAHQLRHEGSAKLGLLTAVRMSKFTRDLRILNAFAAECDCMVLPLPASLVLDGERDLEMLGQAMREFNDVSQVFVAGSADGKWTGNEISALQRQGGELIAAVQRLMSHALASYEAGKPAALKAVA